MSRLLSDRAAKTNQVVVLPSALEDPANSPPGLYRVGLLTTCIFDDDPCVFIENVALYGSTGPVPDGDHRIPLHKLHGGRAVVTGRKSEQSLYDFSLATYDTGDTFDQSLSKGFIEIWSLPSKISARRDLQGK